MKILLINGSPKAEGFTAGELGVVSAHLESRGIEAKTLRLADARIQDCNGCFHCLRTGRCVLVDDTCGIIETMKEADGFVVGSPVRNGLTTACFKRFYERITYTLGFPLLLEEKYTLAISCVGYMGGKSAARRFCGLQDVCHTRLSGFVFCSVGIPAKIAPTDMQDRLHAAADRLIADIQTRRPRRLSDRLSCLVERMVMRRFIFQRHPDVYSHVIQCWRSKGYMK